MDAWEERFNGNPNLVIEYLKGGKSIRIKLYCETEEDAAAVVEQWGGSVRELKGEEWKTPVAKPRPVKIRDALLVTSETGEELERVRERNAGREVITIPPEMAFGTGDHVTTSTCLRFLVDIARERKGEEWSFADLGTGTGVLAVAAVKLGVGRGVRV